MSRARIPFLSLAPSDDAQEVRAAIDRVIARGWFVLGPEVEAFEAEFAEAMGGGRAAGVGTGTDALALILRGLGIGAGDEVITTPVSAAYTALAIVMAGARPIFADVDPDTLLIDPRRIEEAIGPRTRAIMPVHLYGQAADMAAIERIASRHDLAIVEDCCQAHLATAGGRPVGTIGAAGAFSFYPTKNLGALGDAGAVLTRDPALAERIRRIRNGGQTERYRHQEAGINSRLDEMQAAVLRARLPRLRDWTDRRRRLAAAYRRALAGAPVTLLAERDAGHVYHLFVARSPARDLLREHLAACGIETLIHYPVPIPRQPALASQAPAACPAADAACAEVLSLPLHPGLGDDAAMEVAGAIAAFAPRAAAPQRR
ncbi:MAG: DegT/DnrJ/EryC1/StrS family aminotransferase [Acidobacteria bacterium]|nr:DegT/DnrJ/EryC1/StrS family aminotransferase [Acidobacteriota bacterium]